MALTRNFLRSLGLEDDKIASIIEAHTETVDALKGVQADIQKKLETATADLAAAKSNDWEAKYNELNQSFETFKADQAAREARSAKESAYSALLRETGVSEKRIASILKISDIESLELDDAGALKDATGLTEKIKTEWADFITEPGKKGAKVPTPPPSDNGKAAFDAMSLADKMRFANDHPAEYATYTAK